MAPPYNACIILPLRLRIVVQLLNDFVPVLLRVALANGFAWWIGWFKGMLQL